MRRRGAVLLLPLALAACARSDLSERDPAAPDSAVRFAAGAAEDCASAGTDSARAVCVALRAASSEGIPAKVFEVRREPDGFCVITTPAGDRTVGGMAAVIVAADGAVLGMAMSDSVGCEHARPPRRNRGS